ncbi:MAG: ABC transporter substrate-binding protein [Rhodospirillales bacterium]|nr:ABC transporter substrate-binding protein [Rhodospirillales bacterium]MDH3912637.1 ABC transporter substrate-binding protein [Rhodospirillales bacterium]MDH3920533.1 ABC transporter substrate-binding protein [Rhodospirillales bacterium]MDH3969731.1 ABC transporter substrate-binding protein [Rhodospirillales bacterium]
MKRILVALAGAALLGAQVTAAEPVKIGMITTLSGGGSALGIDIRDGFRLAVEQGGGKLGGTAVELIVEDDARKPDKATEIAKRLLERDKVDIVTGIVWSNLAIAVVPKVTKAGAFYISPNAGPSLLAGKGCHENYFNVAWQNDNLHEAIGQYVNDEGFKKLYILAPNYPAGRDSLTGFKRFYKGEIVGEVYTKLGQKDYAAEIAALRDAKPDAVFFFLPGGMGISFLKQYAQAGLTGQIPVFGPAFSFDQTILAAVGDAALGVVNSSQWNKDLDNPANVLFVNDFEATYGRLPSLYASQGYDAARLIASALEAVGGDMSEADAFRGALEAARFESVRGKFRFGPNHHPIQDIYVRQVVKDDDLLTNKILGKAFEDHADAYAGDCKM